VGYKLRTQPHPFPFFGFPFSCSPPPKGNCSRFPTPPLHPVFPPESCNWNRQTPFPLFVSGFSRNPFSHSSRKQNSPVPEKHQPLAFHPTFHRLLSNDAFFNSLIRPAHIRSTPSPSAPLVQSDAQMPLIPPPQQSRRTNHYVSPAWCPFYPPVPRI